MEVNIYLLSPYVKVSNQKYFMINFAMKLMSINIWNLKRSVNKRNDVRIGLSLLLDTNENRQYKKREIIYAKGDLKEDIGKICSWQKLLQKLIVHFEVEKYYKPDEEEKIKIFIGTISKFFPTPTLFQHLKTFCCKLYFFQYLRNFMEMEL